MKKYIFLLPFFILSCVSESPLTESSSNIQAEPLLKSVKTSEIDQTAIRNIQLLKANVNLEHLLTGPHHIFSSEEAQNVNLVAFPVFTVDYDKLDNQEEIIPEECLKFNSSRSVILGYLNGELSHLIKIELDSNEKVKDIRNMDIMTFLEIYKPVLEECQKKADNNQIFFISLPRMSAIGYYEKGEICFKQPTGTSGGRVALQQKLSSIKRTGIREN